MPDHLDRLKTALADHYAIEREIGAGGMATVYLAEDVKHHRQVAVKVLRPDLAAVLGPERFLREIDIAARLEHPHILTLIDSGEADGFLYFVMPYIKGESLREKLLHGELPIAEAVRILRDVADALTHAHGEGLVHRDIKPDNILLSGNHAVVTDFGVAKAVSEATGREKLTTAGVALGTPVYMAPEQAVADPNIDHRADIYALGVLAYEMVAGRPPFGGDSPQAILSAHVTEAPAAVTQHRAAVPPALAELIMQCLEKKAADRWQNTADVLRQLEALATPSGGITPTDTRPLAAVGVGNRRTPIAVAAAAAFVVVAGVLWRTAGVGTGDIDLDPNLVAVFPFRMSGDQQLDYLGEGVVDLFQATLTGDGGPRAVASQTAISAWRRAGGLAEQALTEDEAESVAASLGAGLLLQGSMVGSPDNLVLTATMARVGADDDPVQATASGPVDSVAALTGRLTAQLLSLQAGEESQTASSLTRVSLPALRAYLQGQIAHREGRYEDALAAYGRALAFDSTFALAGLGHSLARGWVLSAPPSPGTRIAWENRDQLGPRDRLFLDAWAVPPGSVTTIAERLALRERVASTLGDRPEAWYITGDYIFHYGELLGMSREDVKERAWAAFQQGLDLDPQFGPILTHKFDQALYDEDSLHLGQLVDSFPGILAADQRLVVATAIALKDSAGLRVWQEGIADYTQDDLTGSAFALIFSGRHDEAWEALDEAIRRATTAAQRRVAMGARQAFLTFSGQPQAAAEVVERMRVQFGPAPSSALRTRVAAALFLDGDTAQARQAVRALNTAVAAPIATETGAVRDQASAVCYVGVWHAARGERMEARRTVSKLGEISNLATDAIARTSASACEMLLETFLADSTEAAALAERLDSLALTGPRAGIPSLNILNLILAGIWESQGRVDRALAAVRRRSFLGGGPEVGAMLREEGRLAALAGDTAGAIWAYDQFLQPRDQAEPAVRVLDDVIRTELARLAGERSN